MLRRTARAALLGALILAAPLGAQNGRGPSVSPERAMLDIYDNQVEAVLQGKCFTKELALGPNYGDCAQALKFLNLIEKDAAKMNVRLRSTNVATALHFPQNSNGTWDERYTYVGDPPQAQAPPQAPAAPEPKPMTALRTPKPDPDGNWPGEIFLPHGNDESVMAVTIIGGVSYLTDAVDSYGRPTRRDGMMQRIYADGTVQFEDWKNGTLMQIGGRGKFGDTIAPQIRPKLAPPPAPSPPPALAEEHATQPNPTGLTAADIARCAPELSMRLPTWAGQTEPMGLSNLDFALTFPAFSEPYSLVLTRVALAQQRERLAAIQSGSPAQFNKFFMGPIPTGDEYDQWVTRSNREICLYEVREGQLTKVKPKPRIAAPPPVKIATAPAPAPARSAAGAQVCTTELNTWIARSRQAGLSETYLRDLNALGKMTDLNLLLQYATAHTQAYADVYPGPPSGLTIEQFYKVPRNVRTLAGELTHRGNIAGVYPNEVAMYFYFGCVANKLADQQEGRRP